MRLGSRWLLAAGVTVLVHAAPACKREEPPAVAEPRPKGEVARGFRPQPRPGERVPQPELDGYCPEPGRGAAFYYHGGSPVVRLAREDGCLPLYISACEDEGRCDAPRDQEPGMWCCAADGHSQAAATAKR